MRLGRKEDISLSMQNGLSEGRGRAAAGTKIIAILQENLHSTRRTRKTSKVHRYANI